MTAVFGSLAVFFAILWLLTQRELANQRQHTTAALARETHAIDVMQTMVHEAHDRYGAAMAGWREATAIALYYERRWSAEQQLQRSRNALVIFHTRFPLSERLN